MQNNLNLKKSYDEVLLVYNILKRLGSGNMSAFEDRIKNQKIQYFAQLFKISPSYDFNLYIRGPYSPDLAHDLYEMDKNKIDIKIEYLTLPTLESRFEKLKKFIKGKTIRELEIVSTLHWLNQMVNLPLKQAEQRLKELKKVSEEELTLSLKELEVLNEEIKA